MLYLCKYVLLLEDSYNTLCILSGLWLHITESYLDKTKKKYYRAILVSITKVQLLNIPTFIYDMKFVNRLLLHGDY